MVELKTPYRYRRHRMIERTLALLDEDAVVVCFEAGAIARVRALRPELRTVQHVSFVPIRLAAARGCWAVGFQDRRAEPARDPGRSARWAWRPPSTPSTGRARMLELASLGVTGVFTDVPRQALEWLERRAEG